MEAIALELRDQDGTVHSLADMKGKVCVEVHQDALTALPGQSKSTSGRDYGCPRNTDNDPAL